MSEFQIGLVASLDSSKSKQQLNSDIDALKKQLTTVEVQAKLGKDVVTNLTQQLNAVQISLNNVKVDQTAINNMISQFNTAFSKVNINLGNINTSGATQSAQKTGQQIGNQLGNSINQSLQANLNHVKQDIQNIFSSFSVQKLNNADIFKNFNLNRAKIDPSVTKDVQCLTAEINKLAREALKTNSDSAWEGITQKISNLSDVLNKFGATRDLSSFKEQMDLLDYFQGKKIFVGDKAEAIQSTGMSIRELNNQFRNLGVTFTTVENGSTKLDQIWSELFNIKPNFQGIDSFGDQINAVVNELKIAKESMYGDSNLMPAQSTGATTTYLNAWLEMLEKLSQKIEILKTEQANLQNQMAQASNNATNTVVANQQKQQQAYQQTGSAIQAVTSNTSIIGNMPKEASDIGDAKNQLSQLLQNEKAVIATTQHFDNDGMMRAFTLNVKRATGEVESLNYAFRQITDNNGNVTDTYFENTSSHLNDSGAIKQIDAIEKAFSDYTTKIAKFKSTNAEILSGLDTPLKDFETKLAGLKTGATTVNEVKGAFNSLNTEAAKITQNFSKQLSPIDRAVSKIANGEETIKGLRAELKGLDNTPKDLSKELNQCVTALQKVKDIEAKEGRTENWSKAYKQWAESIDAVTSKIKTLKKEQSNVASTQVFNTSDLKANNIAYMSKVHNTIEKQMVEINRLANANGWSDVKVTGVEEASGKIQKLTLTVRDAEGALKQFNMQREKIQGNGKAQAGLVQTGDVKVLETAVQYAEKLKSIETSMGQFGNTTTSIVNLENSFTKLGLSTDEVNSKMEAVKTEYATLQNMMSNGASGNEIVNQFEKVNSVLKETQNSLKQTKADYSLLATEYQRLTLANDIEEWNQKNTAATREVIAQNEIYISSLRDLDVAMTKVEHNNIATSFKQTENSMRALNKLGASFSNQFRQAIDSFKVWVSATTVVMSAVNLIRQIPTVVNELDTALVDLRKTTTMTDAQLKEFYTDAPNIAKQMGVGTKAIIDQASAWSRLGYSSKDAATKMAKYSAMFKTISPGMNLDDATDGLVSVMKAFNIGNENVDDVVDGIMSKINIVGNTQAVDNSDIVDFLTRSSSAMAEANNTLEQTIALGTAATEITRDSDSVGNALKTISMRIRGYDEETESYTNDIEQLSGVIANLTKTAKTPGGISLFTDSSKQTFKSTYELLKEISQIYSQLSDKNQAQLLEALAGKRQGQIVASIVDNFSAAEKSMNSMANSAGNAQAEMDVAMDSIDAKANKLKQTGVAISENLLSRDNAKTVLEVANGIAEGFELATKHLGLFKTALLGLSVVGSVKNIGLFKTTKNDSETSLSGQKIVTAFTSRKIAQEEATKQTALDIECLQKYEAECQKGSVSTETFATTMKGASVEAQKYAVNIKNGTGSAQTFATNQKAIQTSVTKTGVASKVAAVGLNIFKTALNMGIMLGVSELITGVIELATYSDKLADSAQSLGNDFKDSENDISDYKDRIQELNDKINDSSTPYADVIQARKDLMTIQNEMIEKYGDEKGAIEDITNEIKGQTDAFNNLNMTQYNKMVNDFNKTGGIAGKIQNAFVGSNFEQMKKNEKSYSDKIDMSYNSELDNYIKSLGAKQVISDRGSYFELNGTLEEVYEKMQNIQEVANQLGEDKYANRLSDQINDAQELTDKYKDMYDAYVLYEQVLKDTDYSSAYQQAMSDYQNYQKQATENGLDSEEAKKASEQYAQNMSETIQKALENGDDEVANYFESLYPDLQSIVETWKFKAKITPELDDGSTNDNYDKKTDKEMKKALGAFNNAEEIKNFSSETATEKQKNAMTTLQKIAEQNFHNDIDALVDAAIQLYDFKTQGEQDFINRINGKSLNNNVPDNLTAGVSATLSNDSRFNESEAIEFYKSLSEEQQKLVNNQAFVDALNEQNDSLKDGKWSADSYANALKEVENVENTESSIPSFSTLFDGSDFGDRISYLSQQFQNGKISAHDYFQSIRDELANTDFSEFTDQAAAAQQFFTDSAQQVASGMSDLINSYNKGEISATEYLDGYTSMAETLSALTDDLQNNSAAWNENGEAISDGTNQALDNAQSDLASAIEGINQYQDSIYSLEQITSGAITAGSDEFTAHAQVIAEDLAYIVQNGGYMADQIASTMGTTTSEIANSLTNSVDNQALASQAIAGNTNASIEQMANAVSTLFAELGNQIGNFKATINFAPKVNGVEHFSAIKIGGKEVVGGDIPNLTYDINGSSSSLKSIGSAISSFGKVLSSNIAAQKVDYKKFSTTPADSSGKERKYTPSKGVTNNYNNKLKNNKSSGKSGSDGKNSGGDAEKQNEEYLDKFMAYQKARLEAGKITYQQYSQYVSDELERMYKNGEISASKFYSAVKDMIDEQKSIYDAALKGVTKLLDDEIDKWQDKIDAIEKNNDKLNEQKDTMDKALSYAEYYLDKEVDKIEDSIDALEKENDTIQDQIDKYDSVLSAIDKVYEDEIERANKEKDAIQDTIDALSDENDEYERNLALQQAIYNWNKAVNQKSKYILKDGQFVYDSDTSAMRDAQDSLHDAKYNIDVANLQKQQDAIDDYIETLNKYKDMWSDVASAYDNIQNNLNATAILGSNYAQEILQNNTNSIENFKNNYIEQKKQIDDNTGLINSYNEKKDTYDKLKERWSDLSQAADIEANKQAAIQTWGAEYEQIILAGRDADLSAFRDNYLAIDAQINDNTRLINSYNEKVDYYTALKQQWEDCTSKYDEERDKLYASQILGANWEADVLSGRQQTLANFTSEYEKLCQRQADAAVNAANAEVQAAKNAQAQIASAATNVASSGGGSSSGGSSSSGSSGSTTASSRPKTVYDKNNNPNKPKLVSKDYWTYEKLSSGYSTSGQASSHISNYASKGANGFTQIGNKYFIVKWIANAGTPANASKAKNKLEKDNPKKIGKYGYAKRYHKGLELGKIEALPKDKAFDLVQDVGINGLKADEVPIIAQKREAVLTEEQIENLAKTLHLVPVQNEIMEKMSKISLGNLPMNTPKMNFDASKVGQSVTKNNFAPSVNITFNCPNLTNESGVQYVEKAMDKYMNKFANDFYQASLHYINRKQ